MYYILDSSNAFRKKHKNIKFTARKVCDKIIKFYYEF